MKEERSTGRGAESPEVTRNHLQKLLSALTSRPRIKQAILALESLDGSLRWSQALGEADPSGTPMAVETPFFLASIDKLFNATLVMMLSERGRLSLDARISAYLPRSLTQGLHRSAGLDRTDQITVRHLLGHTSGLADWLEDRPRGGRSLVERVLQDGDVELGLEDISNLVRDELRPHFPPQELTADRQKVRYSDTNFMLVIAVIEAVTGQPLQEVHEHLLLRPLNLRHTFLAGRSRPLAPTAEPTVLRFEGRPLHIPLLLRSIRGMYSTAGDSLAFLRSFVRGEVFQEPTTRPAMQRRWNRFGFPLDRAALRSPAWPVEYGLGLMRFRLPRLFTPLHPMPPVLGHTGSTGCWLFWCPQLDILLTGSVDEVTAGAVPYRVVPEILRVLRSSSLSTDRISARSQ